MGHRRTKCQAERGIWVRQENLPCQQSPSRSVLKAKELGPRANRIDGGCLLVGTASKRASEACRTMSALSMEDRRRWAVGAAGNTGAGGEIREEHNYESRVSEPLDSATSRSASASGDALGK